MSNYRWPKKIVVTCPEEHLKGVPTDGTNSGGPMNVYVNTTHDDDMSIVIGGYQRVYALMPLKKKRAKKKPASWRRLWPKPKKERRIVGGGHDEDTGLPYVIYESKKRSKKKAKKK